MAHRGHADVSDSPVTLVGNDGGQLPETNSTLQALTAKTANSPGPPLSPVSVLQTPFGIPPTRTLEDYRNEPVCYLSKHNYKLAAEVGPSRKTQQPRLTVLDTGAGPNLIRTDLLPQRLLDELDRTREIVNLARASQHRLEVLGITTLSVTVGSHSIRVPFVAVHRLGTDVILGCHYIDRAINTIEVQRRCITLLDGSQAP